MELERKSLFSSDHFTLYAGLRTVGAIIFSKTKLSEWANIRSTQSVGLSFMAGKWQEALLLKAGFAFEKTETVSHHIVRARLRP